MRSYNLKFLMYAYLLDAILRPPFSLYIYKQCMVIILNFFLLLCKFCILYILFAMRFFVFNTF